MHGYDIELLDRKVTFNEFWIAKSLYSDMRDAGHPATKAAAACYRAGYMAAQRDARERKKKRYAAMDTASDPVSLPEAITFEEGDLTNE